MLPFVGVGGMSVAMGILLFVSKVNFLSSPSMLSRLPRREWRGPSRWKMLSPLLGLLPLKMLLREWVGDVLNGVDDGMPKPARLVLLFIALPGGGG